MQSAQLSGTHLPPCEKIMDLNSAEINGVKKKLRSAYTATTVPNLAKQRSTNYAEQPNSIFSARTEGKRICVSQKDASMQHMTLALLQVHGSTCLL